MLTFPAGLRLSAILSLSLLLALLLVACGDNDASDGTAVVGPTADPTVAALGEAVNLGTEAGLPPIYFRTQDGFQSVVAGEPYKVVVRVTSGYDEETLAITAEPEDGESVDFTAQRAEVDESEDPGSFYVFQLLLPEAGSWQVSTAADTVQITVDVKPPTP